MLKKILQFIIALPIVFAITYILRNFFEIKNRFITILVLIIVIVVLEWIARKIFGDKMDKFLNKW